ncbi:MAG: hypothetical protein ACI39W_10165 [Brotaphodocola sp.]
MEQPQQNPSVKITINFALVSLILGFSALVSCCAPPMQFFCGAAAIMTAFLSRNGQFSGMARVGLILGILSVLCSILIFIQYIAAMRMMSDPANAALVQEATRYYEEFMKTFQAQ